MITRRMITEGKCQREVADEDYDVDYRDTSRGEGCRRRYPIRTRVDKEVSLPKSIQTTKDCSWLPVSDLSVACQGAND